MCWEMVGVELRRAGVFVRPASAFSSNPAEGFTSRPPSDLGSGAKPFTMTTGIMLPTDCLRRRTDVDNNIVS